MRDGFALTKEPGKGNPMSSRTTRTVVSFKEPFSLRAVDGMQPPGDYNVFFEDELIAGVARTAYRRVSATIQMPSTLLSHQEQSRLVLISETDLEVALMKDSHLTVTGP